MVLFLIYFCIFWFYFLYISFVFYGSIEAITEAIYRWFYFSNTASVWLYKRVFTRLVHQPPVYVFGALTTCLRVRCTNHLLIKHWLIRGEAHQYIDYVVCFDTEASHHPNKHMILHVFHARGYDSIVSLSWYKQRPFNYQRNLI